ncbi:MAG: DNA-directed RNA polymerase subunit alpha C-terminal domain-containing protein [Candidatus Uhrbacteria bacterium]
MTAETGMTDRQKLKTLKRFRALTNTAEELIHNSARTPAEVNTLLKALQAFKERRLGAIFFRSEQRLDGEKLLEVLSLPIESTPLPTEDQRYLASRGIKFLGELYYVVFDRRSRPSRERGQKIFKELVRCMNVPTKLDPLSIGWQPPYWSDPLFQVALNQPVIDCFAEYSPGRTRSFALHRSQLANIPPRSATLARKLHQQNIHYLAQYLEYLRQPAVGPGSPGNAWGTGQLEDRRKLLLAVKSSLWAAALVPSDWQAPEEVPASWLVEQTKMLAEQEIWETKKNQEDKLRRQRRSYDNQQHQRRMQWLTGSPIIDQLDDELVSKLTLSVSEIGLPNDEVQRLQEVGVETVRQLVQLTNNQLDLLNIYSGTVIRQLRPLGLFLYMTFDDPEDMPLLTEKLIGRFMSEQVDQIDLSVRTANILKSLKIVYIGQLIQFSEDELVASQKVSHRSLKEIKEVLTDIGLELNLALPIDAPAILRKPDLSR